MKKYKTPKKFRTLNNLFRQTPENSNILGPFLTKKERKKWYYISLVS